MTFIEVKIERGKPHELYDVVVERGTADIVWWAPGASYLSVELDETWAAPRRSPSFAKPAITGTGFSRTFSKDEHTKIKQGLDGTLVTGYKRTGGQQIHSGYTELKYTINATYPDGSQIYIDPKVKIQP